jgi:hypothetical protein
MCAASVGGRQAVEVVVCLRDSVIQVTHLAAPGELCVGPRERIGLPAEALGGATRRVLVRLDEACAATRAGRLDGDEQVPLAEPATLAYQDLKVFVRLVPAERVPLGTGWHLDGQLAATVAGVAVCALTFLALAAAMPDERSTLETESLLANRRAILISLKPTEDEKPRPEPGALGMGGMAPVAVAGSGAEGADGRPEATTHGRTQMVGKQARDRAVAHDPATVARQTGALAVFNATSFQEVVGADREEWGTGAELFRGHDYALEAGNGPGGFGNSAEGTGPGSCPPGSTSCHGGTVGSGGYDGVMAGPRGGLDGGHGGTGTGVRMPARKPGTPKITMCGHSGCVHVEGDIDKAIIRRVIRARLSSFSHCYERAIQAGQPGVTAGTVNATFTIDTNGKVIAAGGTSDAGVAGIQSCVTDIVRSLQFPAVPTFVNVSYPFNFHAAE